MHVTAPVFGLRSVLVVGRVVGLSLLLSCANIEPPVCDNLDPNACNRPAVSGRLLREYRDSNVARRPVVGTPVTVRNAVITAVDDYVEPGGALGDIWVQEFIPAADLNGFDGCVPVMEGGTLRGRMCGVQLFRPRYVPVGSHGLPGDIVSISGGTYDEFVCEPCSARFPDGRSLPELSNTNIQRLGSGPVPAPVDVTLAQIADGGDRFSGVLVRVTDVVITGTVNVRQGEIPISLATRAMGCLDDAERCTSSGQCCAGGCVTDRGTRTCGAPLMLSDQLTPLNDPTSGMTLAMGTRLRNVVGIVSYFFGTKLIPRSVRDYEIVR